jgi:predicted glycoside hydrolase/deacetylase ChbG (UPF0249 family)
LRESASAGKLPPGIIVNADDLGIHPRINAGIKSAYRNGVLTSATMLMTTPYVEETVRDIVRRESMPVGIHLSLTLGKAVASPAQVADLIDEEGYFRFSARQLMLARLGDGGGRTLLIQIRAEIAAQLALARDWGIAATHVDSHQHVHMRPPIYEVIEDEARRFGIERIRFCREPFPRFGLKLEVGKAIRRNNHVKWLLMRRLASGTRPMLATTDRFFGVLYSGIVSTRVMRALIETTDPHCSLEIGIHPGFPCTAAELTPAEDRFADFISSAMRRAEHDLLTDPELVTLMRTRFALRGYDGTIKSVAA